MKQKYIFTLRSNYILFFNIYDIINIIREVDMNIITIMADKRVKYLEELKKERNKTIDELNKIIDEEKEKNVDKEKKLILK